MLPKLLLLLFTTITSTETTRNLIDVECATPTQSFDQNVSSSEEDEEDTCEMNDEDDWQVTKYDQSMQPKETKSLQLGTFFIVVQSLMVLDISNKSYEVFNIMIHFQRTIAWIYCWAKHYPDSNQLKRQAYVSQGLVWQITLFLLYTVKCLLPSKLPKWYYFPLHAIISAATYATILIFITGPLAPSYWLVGHGTGSVYFIGHEKSCNLSLNDSNLQILTEHRWASKKNINTGEKHLFGNLTVWSFWVSIPKSIYAAAFLMIVKMIASDWFAIFLVSRIILISTILVNIKQVGAIKNGEFQVGPIEGCKVIQSIHLEASKLLSRGSCVFLFGMIIMGFVNSRYPHSDDGLKSFFAHVESMILRKFSELTIEVKQHS